MPICQCQSSLKFVCYLYSYIFYTYFSVPRPAWRANRANPPLMIWWMMSPAVACKRQRQQFCPALAAVVAAQLFPSAAVAPLWAASRAQFQRQPPDPCPPQGMRVCLVLVNRLTNINCLFIYLHSRSRRTSGDSVHCHWFGPLRVFGIGGHVDHG